MSTTKLFATVIAVAGLALSAALVTPAIAEPPAATPTPAKHEGDKPKHKDGDKKGDKADKQARIGEAAPAFELKDTDGNTVKLSDFKGKIVVLEWFNPECPFIVKHHSAKVGNMTFNKLHEEYSSKGVVFLAINSSAEGNQGYGKDLNKKMKEEYKLPYPILLDESGKVGKMFGAKTTPHVFVINTEGVLAYQGAIDNNTDATKAGDKNYAKLAIDALQAGKKVETTETKSYGCGVKYAK